MGNFCDIIIPFYNGLNFLRDCIESIISNTDYPHKLLLIDDGSDDYTKQQISQYVEKYPHISIQSNPQRIGYLKSCNAGLRASTGDYVVLLNSDTYVLPGWLERLINCAESDAKIAIVNPLTNMASILSVPIPPGLTVYTMGERIAQVSQRRYPDVVTASGFCLLLKREAMETLGLFDEIYGIGYCEESDYSMRAIVQGWRVAVADNAFVYHKGSGTFGQSLRQEHYARNREIFDQRWEKLYNTHYNNFLKRDPLRYIKQLLFPPPPNQGTVQKWTNFFKEVIRKGLHYIRRIRPLRIFSQRHVIVKKIKEKAITLRSVRDIYGLGPSANFNVRVYPEYVSSLPKPSGLSIVFLATHLKIAGGVISIVQLVNEFIKKGHTVQIATLNVEPEPGMLQLYTRPLIFRSLRDMAKNFPTCDVVVATFWTTAYEWLPRIIRYNPHIVPFYYIQDYESWFYPEGDKMRQKVIESYSYAPNRIVKSDWLLNMLKRYDYDAYKIHLGLNLDIFYPRNERKDRPPYRIVGIVLPDKPRRGFEELVSVFAELYGRRKDVEFVFFGTNDLSGYTFPFPYINYGEVWDQNKVAEIYSSCHVAVDTSLFQGFGRLGLEAMACGTPAVLPKTGGITEYAKDGINCLMVNSENPQAVVDAIESILGNSSLRRKLVSEGKKTAQKFCHKDEAEKMLNLFLKQFEQHKKCSVSAESP
jgi:GT2 family glycosyltransferase/glycosyltransferase involved in cell wall biosynthesis